MKPLYRSLFAALLALIFATPALFSEAKPATPILPQAFAGWELSGAPQQGTDPRKIDSASSSVLTEDRFSDFEVATYKNEDRTITVRAARFADAEGAYAAFTFYRQPLMRPEEIGKLAASLNERILFFVSNVVVDVQFDHLTAMSGAQLRELAGQLSVAKGAAAELPTLPTYLHGIPVVPETTRYLIGPAAYSALNINVSPAVIDFSKSPKVLWARVDGEAQGSAEILLVSYPTHIIAMDKLGGYQQLASQATGDATAAKRSGPIVALVRGKISSGDANRIVSRVNYDANVTWNENAGQSKRDNIGNVVVAALTLAAVLFLISVGAGAVFGFGRFYIPRFRARKAGETRDDGEMIRLDLR